MAALWVVANTGLEDRSWRVACDAVAGLKVASRHTHFRIGVRSAVGVQFVFGVDRWVTTSTECARHDFVVVRLRPQGRHAARGVRSSESVTSA